MSLVPGCKCLKDSVTSRGKDPPFSYSLYAYACYLYYFPVIYLALKNSVGVWDASRRHVRTAVASWYEHRQIQPLISLPCLTPKQQSKPIGT